MKIVPSPDRVIVSPFQIEEETKGGIIIPEASREVESLGTVVASSIELYAEGDTILFSKFAGCKFSIEGEDYIALEGKDCHCKIVEEDA